MSTGKFERIFYSTSKDKAFDRIQELLKNGDADPNIEEFKERG
jgi:pyoverdine/dityrosine biosynthesis protein Dit1